MSRDAKLVLLIFALLVFLRPLMESVRSRVRFDGVVPPQPQGPKPPSAAGPPNWTGTVGDVVLMGDGWWAWTEFPGAPGQWVRIEEPL